MFKRANKMTALLVAAASVMSLVPAMAADSTKLSTQDGTIQNAVAFSDGKYVFEGYKSDDEDQSVYYNDGKEDKELSDVEDADLQGVYGDKYAFARDGKDQYLVDLSNGDVLDDQTPSDDLDNAKTKLNTKLKKTDRYTNKMSQPVLEYNTTADETITQALPGNKFGDTWYAYSVANADGADADLVGTDKLLYGLTNAEGKYIDISHTANVYAYSTAKKKYVKIEEYSNNIADKDDDSELLATLVSRPVVLTQDDDYFYVLTNVAITDAAAGAAVTGGTTTSAVSFDGAKTTLRTFIQKISKEQGDQQDDAYLPKSVESYEIGNADGNEFDCGDAKDAYAAVKEALGTDLTKAEQTDAFYEAEDGTLKPKFTIAEGELTAIYVKEDSIKATNFKFKKDKVEYQDAASKLVGTDKKQDVYFVEKDSDDDEDLDFAKSTAKDGDVEKAFDVDVDGNIWAVADGKIYKFTKGEFTKVYTTDSSLNQIDVYNEKSLITWEGDGDIFATVGDAKAAKEDEKKTDENKKDGEKTTTAPAVTPAKTGWDQLANGTWNFYDATGTKVVSNWVNVGGVWYYLKADGVMATGWLNDRGTWYYLNASGAMQTGWVNDNGTWYYCNASGAMLSSTTVDGYVLGANGAWVK